MNTRKASTKYATPDDVWNSFHRVMKAVEKSISLNLRMEILPCRSAASDR